MGSTLRAITMVTLLTVHCCTPGRVGGSPQAVPLLLCETALIGSKVDTRIPDQAHTVCLTHNVQLSVPLVIYIVSSTHLRYTTLLLAMLGPTDTTA